MHFFKTGIFEGGRRKGFPFLFPLKKCHTSDHECSPSNTYGSLSIHYADTPPVKPETVQLLNVRGESSGILMEALHPETITIRFHIFRHDTFISRLLSGEQVGRNHIARLLNGRIDV